MRTTNYERAHNDALAGMLRLWGPTARRDGADLILEAMDDADFRRDAAKFLCSCLLEGAEDHAEFGRMFWQRIIAYTESLPEFEDRVASELADQSERAA